MAKIIVAFGEERQREQIARALEESGMRIFRRCATGGEVLRTLSACQDGVVVSGTKFPDRTADELAEDLGEAALMLIVGKPERLALCENRRLFRLAAPFTRGELKCAVEILIQLHTMRMPRRSADDKRLVEEAKRLLMDARGLTEPEAHHTLQRLSMNLGIKMTDSARRILNGEDLP